MIAILFIGAFVAFLNNTLLNVALPTIMIEFDVTPSQVQWLTTGYMLVNGILIPASAYLIQKFKNKTLFITAMSLFSLGTLIAWIAPGFWILVAGRMIQACGSAIMMPLLMNVMLIAFPIERRGTAMNNTLQQVSGAIGSAIFLTIMNARMSKWISNEIAIQRQSGEFPVDEGAQQAVMEELTRVGMLEGITFSFFIAAIVTIVALVLSFFIKRVVPKREAI